MFPAWAVGLFGFDRFFTVIIVAKKPGRAAAGRE
jgi:hypothetical protein